MKHLFRSLCLGLALLCGAAGLHATPQSQYPQYAVNPSAPRAEDLSWGQEAVVAKGSSRAYPLVYHRLDDVFYGARLQLLCGEGVLLEDAPHVRLTDQSVWQVDKEDAAKLANWKQGQVLSVQPNRSWFHNKKFSCLIQNLNTGDEVAVKVKVYCDRLMHTMPSLNQFIPSEQCVVLEHGTCWYIASSDARKVFEKWQEGDVMMIGVNHDWFGAPNFLINLSKHDYCQASWMP